MIKLKIIGLNENFIVWNNYVNNCNCNGNYDYCGYCRHNDIVEQEIKNAKQNGVDKETILKAVTVLKKHGYNVTFFRNIQDNKKYYIKLNERTWLQVYEV